MEDRIEIKIRGVKQDCRSQEMNTNISMQTIGVAFGLKILGAIVVYVVGRFLIGLAVRLVPASSYSDG